MQAFFNASVMTQHNDTMASILLPQLVIHNTMASILLPQLVIQQQQQLQLVFQQQIRNPPGNTFLALGASASPSGTSHSFFRNAGAGLCDSRSDRQVA